MGTPGHLSHLVNVSVPGDKSISHRALLFATLAQGESRLRGILPGEDPQATANALRLLGTDIPDLQTHGADLRIAGKGLHGWRAPTRIIDCANSGTTARLLLGMLAAQSFRSTLTGDASLRSRPMRRVTEPLTRMGAHFTELDQPDRLPIEVVGGALNSIEWVNARASAQVKSAILLAGLVAGVPVRTVEPVQSRDHTERMLRATGVSLEEGKDAEGRAFVGLQPGAQLRPLDLSIPGDFSSAAFFLALGLLGNTGVRTERVGLNATRTGLLDVIRRMGGVVQIENQQLAGGEPLGDVIVWPSKLRGTQVTGAEIPSLIDEVPILAILAARAEGETRITGAAELRVKESDRLAALAANLRALGVSAEELPDGLVVNGSAAPLSGRVQTYSDHRIAMAFGVLGALPGNHVEVADPAQVAVSFPTFWDLLREASTAV